MAQWSKQDCIISKKADNQSWSHQTAPWILLSNICRLFSASSTDLFSIPARVCLGCLMSWMEPLILHTGLRFEHTFQSPTSNRGTTVYQTVGTVPKWHMTVKMHIQSIQNLLQWARPITLAPHEISFEFVISSTFPSTTQRELELSRVENSLLFKFPPHPCFWPCNHTSYSPPSLAMLVCYLRMLLSQRRP